MSLLTSEIIVFDHFSESFQFMCGIAGFWLRANSGKHNSAGLGKVLEHMAGALRHRGPDGHGIWHDRETGIGLTQTRLAIIDLSEAGNQPMHSASGRYVLVYNGEIYNHRELRAELEASGRAPKWRGHSDTETLLALIEVHGLDKALSAVCGMFALALWDRKERTLCLSRDRMGEKPLYYSVSSTGVAFASELKALRTLSSFDATLDDAAVTAYLQYGYVPHPLTIYKSCRKLAAGHTIKFESPAAAGKQEAWWSFVEVAESGLANRSEASFDDQVAQTETVLSRVVESQMISDVPLGVFLSGGIDSSLVAALMQSASSGAVKSFSIGFDEARFNESEHAKAVAKHIGSDHTEFLVTDRDALDLVSDLPTIYDEPFADSSQLPTILLSRLTRQQVTVALSGDGGDEVFGGYNRHVSGPGLWNKISKIPRPIRKAVAKAVEFGQFATTGDRSDHLTRLATRFGLPVTVIDKLSRFSGAIGNAGNSDEFYQALVSNCHDPQTYVLNPIEVRTVLVQDRIAGKIDKMAEKWMAYDSLTYLPDDIMVKVDRASMSTSLETRAPFLDVRVVEHAWRLPLSTKIAGGAGKQVLRSVLDRHVPRKLIDRPKQGFAIPLDDWLRGNLAQWAGDLLSPPLVQKTGLLDHRQVTRLWDQHLSGRINAGQILWSMTMLQSWAMESKTAPFRLDAVG